MYVFFKLEQGRLFDRKILVLILMMFEMSLFKHLLRNIISILQISPKKFFFRNQQKILHT
ncbi:Uncharacterised protein [Candidatus Venteria ishoeyi]|uniref:Uncharacterized protein n=1 Tax=Candidatus Venteria ishoeyi TaxID=1899563 RepID=A0A1H6F713_9GAMM|nr:Uncharacterised protein [Candidatus Venteria ishoeyi]